VRKVLTATAVAVGICVAGSACQQSPRSTSPAPTNSVTAPITSVSTVTVTASPVAPVASAPVEVSGSGDTVKTVNLGQGGYTVQYTDSSGFLIVEPVSRDGSTGSAIINATDNSGVATYASTGPVTLQFRNGGEWTLRFVPLS
jgi:hypothetical protein